MDPRQLLGREQELAALRRVVFRGFDRTGSALLVTGEPGIGKTALLVQLRAEAIEAGFRVLSAVGVESETHLPFGGLQQILAPLMSMAKALPQVRREALSTALGLFDGPRPDLFLIAESAQELVRMEGARRPVLILADDLQWLDPQSHQVVAFLGHRSASAGASVIGAARSGHEGAFMSAGFPELGVVGVDQAAADSILNGHSHTLTRADRRIIHEQAQGNPLALLELPAAWSRPPTSIGQSHTLSVRLERAFAGRIIELPVATGDALLLAATDSSDDLIEVLAATSVFTGQSCGSEVFDAAEAAGLVTADGSSLRFRHPLVRSGVLQRETVARRQRAHGALADVLPVGESFRRAWHRSQSITGPDDDIADALVATVGESLRRGAVLSAVASLERAAQLSGSSALRGERLVRAAAHAFEAGRPDLVGRLVAEASSTDLRGLDRARVVWLGEALNEDARGVPARVRELCSAAASSADAGDVGLALNLLLAAALRCWWADNGLAAQAAVLRGLDVLSAVQNDPRHVVAIAIAEPVLRGAEVMRLLTAAGLDLIGDGEALRTYGMAAYAVGDFVLATDLLDRAEQRFRQEGRLGLLPVVLALQLHIRLDLGDWSGAAAAAEEVERMSLETGQAIYADNNVLVEARGIALRGDWQSALALIAGPGEDASRQHLNDRVCLSYQARGTALLSAGRPAEAFASLARQFDPADAGYHLRESFGGLALLAEAAAECARVAEAREILALMETVAVLTPSPLLHVQLLYARAVLADPGAAEDLFRAALAHDLSRWPWLHSRLLLEYGRWLLGAGRLELAGEHLSNAAEVFAAFGAARWSHQAAAALRQIRVAAAHDGRPDAGLSG